MSKINSIQLLIVALFLFAQNVFADEAGTKKEVPYKLIEGKQYEICNTLLPFINTVPHGTLRDQPELLEKMKDFKLPDWQQVKDRKYIDLYIKYYELKFPSEFSKENYKANYDRISDDLDKDRLRFYEARFDIDNTGKKRSALMIESIKDGKVADIYYRFSFLAYDEISMKVDEQYSDQIDGAAFFFQGRTFGFSEWFNPGEVANRWQMGVWEPYYDESRPQRKTPPSKQICTFFAK